MRKPISPPASHRLQLSGVCTPTTDSAMFTRDQVTAGPETWCSTSTGSTVLLTGPHGPALDDRGTVSPPIPNQPERPTRGRVHHGDRPSAPQPDQEPRMLPRQQVVDTIIEAHHRWNTGDRE